MTSRLSRTVVPLALSAAIALGAGAVGASPAQGATNSYGTFTLSAPGEVVEDRPFRVTYSATGNLDAMYVYARPATPGGACAPRNGRDGGEGDRGTLISGLGTGYAFRTPVSEEVRNSVVPEDPGAMLLCGYARQAGNGSMVLPESLLVPVRAARSSVEIAAAPDRVVAGKDADIRITGSTEVERGAYATIVSGTTCPASMSWWDEIGPGPFDETMTAVAPQIGSPGRVCAWVFDGDEVEAVASRPIHVDAAPDGPPPPPVCPTALRSVVCGSTPTPPCPRVVTKLSPKICPAVPSCPTKPGAAVCPARPSKPSIAARRVGRRVSGTATAAPTGARVQLAVRGSWRTLARTKVANGGGFRLRAPAGYAKRRLVVRLETKRGKILAARSVAR